MNLDDLSGFVPFVIVVVMGAYAIVQKIREQQKATERRPGERKPTVVEMPPETRRMIYGGAEPRTARPKTTSTETGDEIDWRGLLFPPAPPKNVEPRTAVPAAPPPFRPPQIGAPRQTTARAAQPQPVQRQATPPRPVAPPSRPRPVAKQAQRPVGPVQSARQVTPPMQTHHTQARPGKGDVVRTGAPRIVDAPEGPREQWKPAPISEVLGATESRPSLSYFESISDVRRAIILSEILGPPKAFQ